MPEPLEDPDAELRRARAMRRLARAFRSTDSYALVLLLIVVTYAIAINVNHRGLTALVLVQVVTVRLALRTSVAHRRVLLAADVLFGIAVVTAVANVFVSNSTRLEPYMFVAATVLYFVAPIAIVRRIAFRREVDQETMLGALAAYLFFGMAFAFTFRYIGAVQNTPFFGNERHRLAERRPLLQLRHAHDDRLRQPRARGQSGPEPGGGGGAPGPAVPGHRGRQDRDRVATQGLAGRRRPRIRIRQPPDPPVDQCRLSPAVGAGS